MKSFSYNDNQLDIFFSSLDRKKKYLLAFSGGSDSTFLFYTLKQYNFFFDVVHVDHGWRADSYEEARQIEAFCNLENIKFIGHVLTPVLKGSIGRDPENTARESRYAFFSKIYTQDDYEGIFLGHHADDQAETVLKRCLEGAGLYNLVGIQEESFRGDIRLLRPLLHLKKQEIINILSSCGISYHHDSTNEDSRYLRARLRQEIIPYLEQSFGKNIIQPLKGLAKESKELRDYLLSEVEDVLKAVYRTRLGVILPLSRKILNKPFLVKFAIKEFLKQEVESISKHLIDNIWEHISKKTSYVTMRLKSNELRINMKDMILEIVKKEI